MVSIIEMRFSVVLFDLDGTVIDSGGIILASMRHAAETVLGRPVPDEQLLAAVGGPGLIEQMRLLDEERIDDLVDAYRLHNEPLHADLLPCEGMLDLLEELTAEGRRLGIVTAKRHATVELAFRHIPALRHLFDVVIASDDTERLKPHPEPLLRALDVLDADAADAAYVGDSPFDVEAAKAARVFAVAVTWGRIHDERRLAAAEPDALVHTSEELRAVLA